MRATYIYGTHAVKSVIENHPERVQGVFVSFGAEKEFASVCRANHIRMEPLSDHDFRKELQGAVHQGVVAKVAMDGLVQEYGAFMRGLEVSPSTCLVLMNEITDPHNVGAIIRSAAAFGAAGVLIPAHNQAPITGTVAKASAGTVFAIPIVAISNENQTIEDLKKRKFWVYGLSGEKPEELTEKLMKKNQMQGAGKAAREAYKQYDERDAGAPQRGRWTFSTVFQEKFDAPAVIVVGSEGEGLRAKTREHCDILLRIPMHPRAESLNASVSAAVVLAKWSEHHPEALAD